MRYLLVPFLAVFIYTNSIAKPVKLKATKHLRLKVEEPSDICLSSDLQSYFVVGNRGGIIQMDSTGKVLMKKTSDGSDYEAVALFKDKLLVVDESYRRIDVYNPTNFLKEKSVLLQDGGARNQSFEGITYLPTQHKIILITEKPVRIIELNEDLQIISDNLAPQFKELSSATWANNKLFLLSDEEEEIYEVDSNNYSKLKTFKVPILNPEGLAFDKNGKLLIVSDDRQTLYTFPTF